MKQLFFTDVLREESGAGNVPCKFVLTLQDLVDEVLKNVMYIVPVNLHQTS